MIERRAPEGKFRVVGVDLFDGADYLIDDYADEEMAKQVANEHNEKRKIPLNDVFCVYDDQGVDITDQDIVYKVGISP